MIQSELSQKDFGSILSKYSYYIHPGDIVAGTVFNRECEGFLVDIGVNIVGYLPLDEISLDSNYISIQLELDFLLNYTRDFFILAFDKKRHQLLLSIKRLDYIRAWKRVKQIQTEDILFTLMPIKLNKGGVVVFLESLQSFIPRSHLSLLCNYDSKLLQKEIQCKLMFVDENNNKLILSHKLALLSAYADVLKIGAIIDGHIVQVKQYGIFISIHGILALLHISEIGYTHIDNIYSLFKVGKKIKVKVIHVDMKQGRLSVSRRELN
uniref:Ribosomal protein S1 n=1 Tax=Melanthalia intermedia TaxID=172989 RepID=A0A345UAZ4_9FLOR|nr:ribosomal protein S1 [Melanthalia intermedia]AXI97630.1 ribosomal protein S1 [Melanthalia intermedia]